LGQLTLLGGVRADRYDGLSHAGAIEPRLGISYLFRPTNTVLRLGYGRLFDTPYNENLVLSSATGAGGLATTTFGAFGGVPLRPGIRNQFNAGLQQGFGRLVVMDAEYFWKFTHNAFDFDTLFNSPITFPINWRKSKIDGLAVRVTLTAQHGFSAYSVMGHTRARFFGPEVGGIIFNSPISSRVFRIDHDQKFEQTTHLQYQPTPKWPWVAMTWRFDSGLVAGSVPDAASALALTADQQASIGLRCGSVVATLSQPLTSCNGPLSAALVRIPAPGTANEDTNPPRVAPRNLFDMEVGSDNVFRTDRAKITLTLSALNLTNKVSLYNFLSTFSGTHFVAPRTLQVQMGLVF
ncbi:MAG: TonB-dependent receptor domain-containing protein, partial [Terriglobales bacterium]